MILMEFKYNLGFAKHMILKVIIKSMERRDILKVKAVLIVNTVEF